MTDYQGGPKETDSPKLFVGQIPRQYSAAEIEAVFQEYGPISEISIIRDHSTQQSKGCAFLSFVHRQSALNAIASLHDKRVLPGMVHPVQIKPADNNSEGRNEERKLFVGMLSQQTNEEYLQQLFAHYGTIEEIAILRNPDGTNKGCAFVRFANRMEAQAAINALHNQLTLPGARTPLIVRFAESEREKAQKKALQQVQMQQQLLLASLSNQLGLGQTSLAAGLLQGGAGVKANPLAQLGLGLGTGLGAGLGAGLGTPDLQTALQGVQQFNATGLQGYPGLATGPARPTGVRSGPEGANLFIANFPAEFNDSSLATLFMPYGNVISAKVFIDKMTGLSKQFGFVSFDNPSSAQAAIQAMNGYTIGARPLKVALKTPSSHSPY